MPAYPQEPTFVNGFKLAALGKSCRLKRLGARGPSVVYSVPFRNVGSIDLVQYGPQSGAKHTGSRTSENGQLPRLEPTSRANQSPIIEGDLEVLRLDILLCFPTTQMHRMRPAGASPFRGGSQQM